MSESRHDRHRRLADCPDGVTDPLLWRLALEVADAHEPDDRGGCRSLLCADQSWPCAAWHNAQRALQMAQTAPDHADRWSTDGARPGDPTTRRMRPAARQQTRREQDAAA